LNRLVGLVAGGFQFAVGAVGGIGPVMEAVGQGAIEALVDDQKQESDLEAFVGDVVGAS
jgi:hypothetical protein